MPLDLSHPPMLGLDARRPPVPLTTHAAVLAALVLAIAARELLDPVLANALPLVTAFAAVAFAVWVAGSGAAVLVAVLAYLACHYLFMAPRYQFYFEREMLAGAALYGCTCLIIIAIGAAMRAAQARARARGDLLRATLSGIEDAVVATDAAMRLTYLNAAAESLTGRTAAEIVGQPIDALFRTPPASTAFELALAAQQPPRRREAPRSRPAVAMLTRNGRTRRIEHDALPMRDGRGTMCGFVVTFRDVTERERRARQEAERARAAQLLASIVESSEDAIVSTTLDGVVQTWNAAAERLYGYPASAMIGERVARIVPRERADAERTLVFATLQSGHRVEHFETERVHKTGRRVVVSLTISPIVDEAGEVVAASEIARDVTKQREADMRERVLLRESALGHARFRTFFDQSAILAAIIGADGLLLEPNRQSCEAAGYAREQLVGKALWESPWWGGVSLWSDRLRHACREAAQGTTFRAELPCFDAHGNMCVAEVSIAPMREADGGILFLALTAIDIGAGEWRADDPRGPTMLAENRQGVRVDIAAPLRLQLPGPKASASAGIASLRVLVVDADREDAAAVVAWLEDGEHDVRTAHDGVEALEIAYAYRPAVVVLAIDVPGVDGCEICARLRERAWGEDVLIVALAAADRGYDRTQAIGAGFDACLPKPVDFAALSALLARHFEPSGERMPSPIHRS